MNIDTEIQTVRDDSNLFSESSDKRQRKFKGKKLNKYLPTSVNVFFSKKSSSVSIDKKIDFNKINVSLQSMCAGTPAYDKEKTLKHVAYIPTTHRSVVLIASLPRSTIFNDEAYERLPMKDAKYFIAKTLLDIPDSPIILEKKTREGGGKGLYNVRPPSSNSAEISALPDIENVILPRNIELKTWDSSIIYIKKYFPDAANEIYNLTYTCGGAMCIESNISLLSDHELSELKKDNDMKAILETKSVNKKYNFSIYVNSVITDLTENIYLNFFNIPEENLKSILKNPDIDSLELTRA